MEKILKAVLSNRIFLTRTDELAEKLASELTYELPGPTKSSMPVRICNVSGINSKILSIPIGRIDLIPKNYTIIEKRIFNEVQLSMNSSIILRDSQKEIYDLIDDNWIVNAKPGWGKTFTALAIAEKLKQKTLIIVHTVKIRNQWVSECKKMFGFEPGIIGSGKFDTSTPIVISNVQTLKDVTIKVVNLFGTIIVDEVHHLPAKSFKEIVDKIRSRYKIGLTGTLGRRDKQHLLIPDFISNNIYKPTKENVVDPMIIIYNSKFSIPGNYMMPWANRINQLAYNETYQQEIIDLVNAQTKRGHKVLIVSDRIEFLRKCSEKTKDSICITSTTKEQKSLENEIKTGSKTSLYGSISIYKEGISINELSCLILATPTNNEYLLEQLIGRIMRLCNNKMKPEVIDIVMDCKTGKNQFKTRKAFYINEGYKIATL